MMDLKPKKYKNKWLIKIFKNKMNKLIRKRMDLIKKRFKVRKMLAFMEKKQTNKIWNLMKIKEILKKIDNFNRNNNNWEKDLIVNKNNKTSKTKMMTLLMINSIISDKYKCRRSKNSKLQSKERMIFRSKYKDQRANSFLKKIGCYKDK